jgi:hypothetical protein
MIGLDTEMRFTGALLQKHSQSGLCAPGEFGVGDTHRLLSSSFPPHPQEKRAASRITIDYRHKHEVCYHSDIHLKIRTVSS